MTQMFLDLFPEDESSTQNVELVNSDDRFNTERDHPLYVAKKWNFELDFKDTPNGRYYHAVQWVKGLGASNRETWSRLKSQLLDSNQQLEIKELPYLATNNKTYQVDYISQQSCYLVAQEMRVTKKRPQLKEIKEYLAISGCIVNEIIKDNLRITGKRKRNEMTAAAKENHINASPEYGRLTNAEYHILFETQREDTAKKELVRILGLNKTQASRFRDHLHTLALSALSMAEEAIAVRFRNSSPMDTDEQLRIVREAARYVAPMFHDLADWAGVDLITGQPLLESGE